ncbi:hypothetical protein HBHAL_3628 [Halobacillus halophilus DSM 2266]|uniref:Uncharacterized protein n=1 Tax=Halobacillus halophilus (strain ATCC 35676 / DSM 2266 / JCM 20832 / KCTC 3685 / LMG 17431 / NBRC 102448 / NCIMB 2269) TaxID=866895 RepID=I0JPA3_HALH3|nr:hypothetical protein HBHAL_3628 [Halobacillus halophilus DSM 2266]
MEAECFNQGGNAGKSPSLFLLAGKGAGVFLWYFMVESIKEEY